jgi:uncharacterized protein
MWRSLLKVALLAPLTACATLSTTARSYLTAPNGLQIDDDRVRTMMQRGLADSALRAVGNRRSPLSPDDRLLRLLYQGTTARYAGRFAEAGAFFDEAFSVSEDRFTKSITRTAASLLTNDFALPYTAGQNERLLLHYNALLAWSGAGDADAAAVEARRMVALLARIGDGDAGDRSLRGMLHAVASAAFEQAGDWTDADVARRNAARLGVVSDSLWAPPAGNEGDVVVVIERGDVAHKVAVGLTVPIFSDDDGNRSASAAERLLGDFGALRNGGVWWDDTPSWRFTNSRDGRFAGVRASYLLDMSWPVLRRSTLGARGAVLVRAGELSSTSQLSVSLSEAVASDYRRDRGAILSRTLARAISKYVAARAVEEAARSASKKSDDDEKDSKKKGRNEAAARAAGVVARVIANSAATALERADTRSWTLLPGGVSVMRLRLPAGTHELLIDSSGSSQLSLPSVVVRAGRTTIISARLWREAGEGVRTVVQQATGDESAPQR